MHKDVAFALEYSVQEIARILSDPTRAGNKNGETFELNSVDVISEDAAAVVYEKDTGKRVLMFFFWSNKKWRSFPVTTGHCCAMSEFRARLAAVESYNYTKNFS